MIMKRYLYFWLVLVVLAFINGMLREFTYKNAVGEPWAHQISVVTGILLLGVAIWFAVKRWSFSSRRQAIAVGIIWVMLTEIFEAAMVMSEPQGGLDVFLQQHNIAEGEWWPLVVLWVGIAPVIFYHTQNKKF